MNEKAKEQAEQLRAELSKMVAGFSENPKIMEATTRLSTHVLAIAYSEDSPEAQGLFFAIGMAANALATHVASEAVPEHQSKRMAMEIIAYCMTQTVIVQAVSTEAEAFGMRKYTQGGMH